MTTASTPLTSDLPAAAPPGSASAAQGHASPTRIGAAWLGRWWPLCLGLLTLVASTSWRFAESLWQQPEYEHGPLLLAVALVILWMRRTDIVTAPAPRSSIVPSTVLVLGSAAYLLGVRLKAQYIEFGALVPVIAGSLALVGGWPLVRRCLFALLFLLLATPLPSPVVFYATASLKEWVSRVAELVLHVAGYPVARDGVTLRVGQYSLLMADACSGMNSLISLSAVGLLYVYLTARRRIAHAVLLVAAIVPVAISTNIVRVIILTLITYHLGDEAGQGFLHEFAGFVMFLFAVLLLAMIDRVLVHVLGAPLAPAGGASAS
jgi:exosortase B